MSDAQPSSEPETGRGHRRRRRERLVSRLRVYVRAVREGDEAAATSAVLELSRTRRRYMPLAFVVGGLAMLFNGLKLLVTNWRLTVVQILPAMWIWLAMFDLKAHALRGAEFHPLFGPWLIPSSLVVIAVTMGAFYLNGVFGFAIVDPDGPRVRPAMRAARGHLRGLLGAGFVVGVALAFAVLVVPRWGTPWFGLCLGIVVGVMMVAYVAVPARLIGVKSTRSRRDKLTASMVGGAMGVVVCAPSYLMGRIGLLMLSSSALLIPGIIVFAVGIALQAGATGAVKAVKLSASLVTGGPVPPRP